MAAAGAPNVVYIVLDDVGFSAILQLSPKYVLLDGYYSGSAADFSKTFGKIAGYEGIICGASAIAAVEPFADATEEEVAYSIALVASRPVALRNGFAALR